MDILTLMMNLSLICSIEGNCSINEYIEDNKKHTKIEVCIKDKGQHLALTLGLIDISNPSNYVYLVVKGKKCIEV